MFGVLFIVVCCCFLCCSCFGFGWVLAMNFVIDCWCLVDIYGWLGLSLLLVSLFICLWRVLGLWFWFWLLLVDVVLVSGFGKSIWFGFERGCESSVPSSGVLGS